MNAITNTAANLLDGSTDHEEITVGKVTIRRGDIVTIAGSSIPRVVACISDKFGIRAHRMDSGTQAASVWTKQYARITVVHTAAEFAEMRAAKPARKPRTTRKPEVTPSAIEAHTAILAEIALATADGDSVGRNKAIVAAANAGVERKAIAAAAGLRSVGRYIRAAQREVTA